MLNIALYQFAKVERGIGRQREFEADRAGSSVAGPKALSTALLKLSLFMPVWSLVVEKAKEAIRSGGAHDNMSVMFKSGARFVDAQIRGSLVPEEIAAPAVPHPVDTHPTTRSRIEALGIDLRSITQADLEVPELDATTAWFDAIDQIENDLTELQHGWLVATNQVPPPLSGLSRHVRRPPPLSKY